MTAESVNGPYFLGAVSHNNTVPTNQAPHLLGSPLWENEPSFITTGGWQESELRTVSTSLGNVAFMGHCLASDAALQTEVQQSLKANDLGRLTHLPGNYTTLATRPNGEVTIMSDLAGRLPVYYTEHKDKHLVSSRALPLADIRGAKFDPIHAAARFACPFIPFLTHEHSYWQGVHSLEAGQRLRIHEGRIQVDSYDPLVPDADATFQDAANALRNAMQVAIASRMAQKSKHVTGDLSGGYDSSSLAMLAANISEDPFNAFMFHNATHRTSEGDLEHAERLAKAHDNVTLHIINTAGHIPYQNLEDLPFRDEPDAGSLMPGGRDLAYLAAIQAFGSVMHITGGGGDSLFTPNPTVLTDLIGNREFSKFFKDGVAVARLGDAAPLQVLYRAIALHYQGFSRALMHFASNLGEGSSRTPETLWKDSFWLAPHLLTPTARAELATFAQERARRFTLPEGLGIGDSQSLTMMRHDARSYHRSNERARDIGLAFHVPYLDHNIIRASTLAAGWKRYDPRRFKSLLVSAMEGLVPPEVFERQTKGDYSADLYQGLRASKPQLMRLFNDSALADLGIIEPKKVQHTIECIATEQFSLPALNNLVAIELWARNLSSDQLPPSLPRRPETSATPKPKLAKPIPKAPYFTIAPHVYAAAAHDGSIIFMNENKRRYRTTTPTAGIVLQTLNRCGGSPGLALAQLMQYYPTVETSRLHKDLKACLQDALTHGLLSAATKPATKNISRQGKNKNHRPSSEVLAAWDREATHVKGKDIAIGVGAFVTALALKRLPFRWTPAVLQKIQHLWATEKASEQEALRALAATHAITRWYLGRVACVEESITSALLLAIKRRKVSWHVGAAFDYARPHAYISVNGSPIGQGKQSDYVPFISSM